jgi:hypothetical protein
MDSSDCTRGGSRGHAKKFSLDEGLGRAPWSYLVCEPAKHPSPEAIMIATTSTSPKKTPGTPTPQRTVPTSRLLTTWTVLLGGMFGFWCLRPYLTAAAFALLRLGHWR